VKPKGLYCIIMDNKKECKELRNVLSATFERVDVVESVKAMDALEVALPVTLLVVSDSFPGGMNRSLLEEAKAKLKPQATICLMERVDPEREIGLRAAGLTFLGTYSSFGVHAKTILKGFQQVSRNKKLDRELPES
jgi:hypothetical protein